MDQTGRPNAALVHLCHHPPRSLFLSKKKTHHDLCSRSPAPDYFFRRQQPPAISAGPGIPRPSLPAAPDLLPPPAALEHLCWPAATGVPPASRSSSWSPSSSLTCGPVHHLPRHSGRRPHRHHHVEKMEEEEGDHDVHRITLVTFLCKYRYRGLMLVGAIHVKPQVDDEAKTCQLSL